MNVGLYRVMINVLADVPYDKLNTMFGSFTIEEILAERNKMHIEDVCDELGISRETYDSDAEWYEQSYYERTMCC